MHVMNLLLDRAEDAKARIRVCRLDGAEVAIRLRLLGYDGCEFATDEPFAADEQINIHLYRMGWIRARISSVRNGIIEAEFAKDCLV